MLGCTCNLHAHSRCTTIKMAGCSRTFPCFILERGTEGRDLTINFNRVPIGGLIGYRSYLTLRAVGCHVPAPGCNRGYRERAYERRYDSGERGVGPGHWATKVPAPASPGQPAYWLAKILGGLVLVGEVANTAGSSAGSHTQTPPTRTEPLPPLPSPAFPTSQDLVKHRQSGIKWDAGGVQKRLLAISSDV